MKIIYLLILCIGLTSCDRNTNPFGKCIPTETANKFLCGCIVDNNQGTPFVFPQERNSFELNSVTPNAISDCDKKCTDFCSGFTPDYILGNW